MRMGLFRNWLVGTLKAKHTRIDWYQNLEHSSYIRSSTKPFNDEMKLDQERVKRWLAHFGLLTNDIDWVHVHVSGHGSRDYEELA